MICVSFSILLFLLWGPEQFGYRERGRRTRDGPTPTATGPPVRSRPPLDPPESMYVHTEQGGSTSYEPSFVPRASVGRRNIKRLPLDRSHLKCSCVVRCVRWLIFNVFTVEHGRTTAKSSVDPVVCSYAPCRMPHAIRVSRPSKFPSRDSFLIPGLARKLPWAVAWPCASYPKFENVDRGGTTPATLLSLTPAPSLQPLAVPLIAPLQRGYESACRSLYLQRAHSDGM